jgi:hypothetical protein
MRIQAGDTVLITAGAALEECLRTWYGPAEYASMLRLAGTWQKVVYMYGDGRFRLEDSGYMWQADMVEKVRSRVPEGEVVTMLKRGWPLSMDDGRVIEYDKEEGMYRMYSDTLPVDPASRAFYCERPGSWYRGKEGGSE